MSERIRALDLLHAAGIKTFAMIAPILPGVEGLIDRLPGKVDNILVDRLNYAHANRVYAANNLEWAQARPVLPRQGRRVEPRVPGQADPGARALLNSVRRTLQL